METAAVVFEHEFDEVMMNDIVNFRAIRLAMAEKQLADLPGTFASMKQRGLVSGDLTPAREAELKRELNEKIAVMRVRCAGGDVVFVDELEMYVKMSRSS
jgi:hypothetical protein